MFQTLKDFLSELTGTGEERRFSDNDYRLATAALLVHLADIDGSLDKRETELIHKVLSRSFGLDNVQIARLVASAEEKDRDSASFSNCARLLKRVLDPAGRARIIGMMWDLAEADGITDEVEETFIWRIAHLLDIPAEEVESLRRKPAPGRGQA
jgi:uncharacterized tellurite resistance protein B-like protein